MISEKTPLSFKWSPPTSGVVTQQISCAIKLSSWQGGFLECVMYFTLTVALVISTPLASRYDRKFFSFIKHLNEIRHQMIDLISFQLIQFVAAHKFLQPIEQIAVNDRQLSRRN
jgi:hypothetical protein